MNVNNYRKVVHACIWFEEINQGDKLMLSKVLKECWHKNFWQDAGGKMEKGEKPLDSIRREVFEETGLGIEHEDFEFVDSFIFPEREIKTFIFEVFLPMSSFQFIKNTEPHKMGPWKLFTKSQALKLKLIPSICYYLENL